MHSRRVGNLPDTKNIMAQSKQDKRARVKKGIRKKISGTGARPRLSVFRSAKHISAQVIDDAAGKTLASATDAKLETKGKKGVEIATLVGAEIGKKAKEAGISKVIFDRGANKYHGRVQALADAAREAGLEF